MNGVEHLPISDFFEQHSEFARRRNVFVTTAGSLDVDHMTAQASFFQAQAGDACVDVFRANAVDQDVRRRIVTEDHHKNGEVAQSHGYGPVTQHVEDGVSGHRFASAHGVLLIK